MKIRPKLRSAGTCLLASALVVTLTQVTTQSPASADDPVTVITSPPVDVGGGTQPPPLTVTVGNPVNGSASVVIDNPGGTAPTPKQCFTIEVTKETVCTGLSHDTVYPNGTFFSPEDVKITNAPTAPGGLPGDKMDWIIDEAYTVLADVHGVLNDDLIRSFARPDVRAYVEKRLNGIVNKKLYGKPMTAQEESAYDALEEYYKTNQVQAANAALAEYNLWTKNPCLYRVPAPPAGSGLPEVPNPVIGTIKCSAAAKVQAAYTITNGTPPSETFEKWASYRHPKALVLHANDAKVRYMIGKTREAAIAVGVMGVAVVAGIGIGMALAVSATVVSTALAAVAYADVSALAFGATAAAAGPLIIVVAALIVLAVAIWQVTEDAKPGEEVTDRAAQAAANTDPLGVRGRIADYAGLDIEHSVDPAGQEPAIVHTTAFKDGLEALVAEWMMFDEGGDPILDPVAGYTVTESKPDDLHFADDGTSLPRVDVKAPSGALNRDGKAVSDYRVLFSRGWLMVSERRSDTGAWSAYRPQLALTYVDQTGELAQMSLIRHQEGDDPAELQFSVTRPKLPRADQVKFVDEWTFTKTGGGTRTVTLLPFDPILLPVNVLPSVQGILTADNVVRFDDNLSTPGQSLTGTHSWTLERLDDKGAVVETISLPDEQAVSKRLLHPGRYRATATFTTTTLPSLTRTGTVEFTMDEPAPEVLSAEVRDDRVLDGSLFLDLRMLQSTRSDTFTVDVDWADDARGNKISKTYTVQCEDTESAIASCDTGPMILPDDAPTNGNWSESPTFRIPDDQDFLPEVTVKITNSYGHVTTKTFPIEGDHRPKYASQTPSVVMPAGKFSRIDVVEVFPSPLLTESQNLTILPYYDSIVEQLPEGVRPDLEKRGSRWFLQITGTPQADAIGPYMFYFPFEQEPQGKALRPPPALASVEIKAAAEPGYRSILRGTPTEFLNRQYRNKYPDYTVQVAQVLADGQSEFGKFTGKVKCKLTTGPNVVFDKVCAADKPFPWPAERISDTMVASTYLQSSNQLVSDDGAYEVNLSTKFVDPTVRQVAGTSKLARFAMALRDLNVVLPPFKAKGYTVKCSRDRGAYASCFDNGALSLPRVPGRHTLDVRVTAPDGASTTTRLPWVVTTPKASFKVKVTDKRKKRGAKIWVTATRLLPGESYVVRINGRKVVSGKASLDGGVRKKVRIPRATHTGKVSVTVRGATASRSGKDMLRVVRE
ncbi:hypothetical protein [Aeromicrobium sp. P5_D10]